MKPTVKWVKRARAWSLTTYEFDKKKNLTVNRVSWHQERPEIPTEEKA